MGVAAPAVTVNCCLCSQHVTTAVINIYCFSIGNIEQDIAVLYLVATERSAIITVICTPGVGEIYTSCACDIDKYLRACGNIELHSRSAPAAHCYPIVLLNGNIENIEVRICTVELNIAPGIIYSTVALNIGKVVGKCLKVVELGIKVYGVCYIDRIQERA